MPADIEEFEDGSAAFAAAREPGWHRLGTVTEDVMTAEEALKIAHLDWKVDKVPAFAQVGDGEFVPIEGKHATVRKHPKKREWDALGVVGSRYVPVQNVEVFSMLDAIVDEGGAKYETAGALANGKKVFMTMKFPEHMTFGDGQDTTNLYLLATNSHDGTSSLTLAVVPLRVVCQNTLTVALRSARRTYKMRHTTNATRKAQFARDALAMTFSYVEAVEKEFDSLLRHPMTDKQFDNFLAKFVPEKKDPTPRQTTNRDKVVDTLWELWNGPTQEPVKNTRYAAFNTVVEYVDWFSPVKGKDQDARRAERSLSAAGTQKKGAALAMLKG